MYLDPRQIEEMEGKGYNYTGDIPRDSSSWNPEENLISIDRASVIVATGKLFEYPAETTYDDETGMFETTFKSTSGTTYDVINPETGSIINSFLDVNDDTYIDFTK